MQPTMCQPCHRLAYITGTSSRKCVELMGGYGAPMTVLTEKLTLVQP